MSPMPPGGGDDVPQENPNPASEWDASFPPQIAAPAGGSSSDDDEEIYSNMGYQPLPVVDPETAEIPDDGLTQHSSEPHQSAAESSGGAGEYNNSILTSPHLQVPFMVNPEASERAELWNADYTSRNTMPMEPEHVEKIRNVMSNFTLPESCHPSWAQAIPEDEWKEQLISRITQQNTSGNKDSNNPSSDVKHVGH